MPQSQKKIHSCGDASGGSASQAMAGAAPAQMLRVVTTVLDLGLAATAHQPRHQTCPLVCNKYENCRPCPSVRTMLEHPLRLVESASHHVSFTGGGRAARIVWSWCWCPSLTCCAVLGPAEIPCVGYRPDQFPNRSHAPCASATIRTPESLVPSWRATSWLFSFLPKIPVNFWESFARL